MKTAITFILWYMYKPTHGQLKSESVSSCTYFFVWRYKNYVNFKIIKLHLKENVCQKKEESSLYDINYFF